MGFEIIKKAVLFSEVFQGLDLSLLEQACEMLKLLNISDFSRFEETYQNIEIDFMQDGGTMESIVIWLKLCESEIEIQNTQIHAYNHTDLKRRLIEFKKIALIPTIEESMAKARELCNALGINVVIHKAIRNSKIRGALTTYKTNPTIYLSARFKSHDHIWFALMHEIGHLLLHYNKKSFILSLEETKDDSLKEQEANKFASDFFIDDAAYQTFVQNHSFHPVRIKEFAKQQEVLPGIVVARLQHDRLLRYNQYNDMKNT